MAKFKTLDDARIEYLEGKITAQEFHAILKKFTAVDNERKKYEKDTKKIERKLATV